MKPRRRHGSVVGKRTAAAAGGSVKGGRPTQPTRARDCSCNSRSTTKESSQHLGPRPKLIDASFVTGRNKSVQKIRTNTVPKKTLRSQLLTSRISKGCNTATCQRGQHKVFAAAHK